MGIGLIIFAAISWLVGPSLASTMPWYVGEPVAQVLLEASDGVLPPENLEALLRTQAGQRLDVGTIRADVALLIAAGGFASVEAMIEPWVGEDIQGDPVAALLVRYRVIASKRVSRVDIRGARGPSRRIIEDAMGVDLGDAWHDDENMDAIAARIVKGLEESGWTRAVATVASTPEDDGFRIVVEVKLGLPQRVGSIRVGGDAPVVQREVRGWLREAGIRVGRQVDNREQDVARLRVVDRLRGMGFDRARVNVFVQERGDDNRVEISVLISPGPRLMIEGRGRGLPNERIIREVLSLRAGDRITQNSRDDAAERMEQWFAKKGYLDAEVDIESLADSATESRVYVRTKRGRRHWLARVRWPEGAPIDREEALAIMRDASPDAIANGYPTLDGLERSRVGLIERLNGMGYLDAEVQFVTENGRTGWVRLPVRYGIPVRVEVDLDTGPQVDLDGIVIRGGLGLEGKLVDDWGVEHNGSPLDATTVLELEQRIVELYEEAGFLEVSTDIQTTRDRIKSTASIGIRVEPGQPVELRSIVVRGNRRTKRHVIEREVVLNVGQPVSPSALADTRSNLYNLDLFRLVSPELVGDETGSQDLLIQLEERSNILLEAGGGISTDQGIRTTGRATHRNIAGLGHRLTGLGSVGYGWFGDEWHLDTATPVWRAAARYELPYVPGRGGRLVMEGLINESLQEPNWRLSRSGGSVGMKMRLSNRAEAVVDYRVQVRRLVDVDSGMLVNGDPWLAAVGLGEDMEGDPILTSAPRVISGGSLLLVRDGRDDRFNPRSGGNWSTHLEVGDGVFSGTVTMRATTHVERLVPMGPLVLDLVGRGGLGFAQGRSVTLPLDERFFLGGGSTLRGFQLNSVGPANFTARPEVAHPNQTEPVIDGLALPYQPAQWVATGGDAMAAATIEIRVPLPVIGLRKMDGTSIVFFSDTGHVGFLNPTVVTTSRLEARDPLIRTSFGAGLRIATPIGPASFDVGINPNPLSEREEPFVLPHLSLGVL